MSSGDPSSLPPRPVLPYADGISQGGSLPYPDGPVNSLNREQLGQLAVAQTTARKLKRVKTWATLDAWTVGILGALSLICGGYSSPISLILGVGMVAVAVIEAWAVRQWDQLNPRAARVLGYNQIFFAALLVLYGGWSMIFGSSEMQAAANDPALAGVKDMLGDVSNSYNNVMKIVYLFVILEAILVQGGTAWYYITREKILQKYIAETPPWITQMQRAGVTI